MTEQAQAGVRVRAVLRHQGRTVSWAARQLGVDRSTLAGYLSGRRPLPPHHAVRLADLVGLPPAVLTPPVE